MRVKIADCMLVNMLAVPLTTTADLVDPRQRQLATIDATRQGELVNPARK